MAEDKNTVGLTIKIGELESLIKDTLGSPKDTAWENVGIISKPGTSHEIAAAALLRRLRSSSKKTGVPLSEVFNKLEPYPEASHILAGKQVVSTVKGHPGSVTMHKTPSLIDGTTSFFPHTVAKESSAHKLNKVFNSDIYKGQTSHDKIRYPGHYLKRIGLVLVSMNANNPGAVRAILPKGTPDDPDPSSIRYGKVLNPAGGFPASVTVESNIKGTHRPIGGSDPPSVASGASSLGTGGGNRSGGGSRSGDGGGGGPTHQLSLLTGMSSSPKASQSEFDFNKKRMLDARLGTATNLVDPSKMGFGLNGSVQYNFFEANAPFSALGKSLQAEYPRALIGIRGRGSRALVTTYATTRDALGREFTMWLNPMTGKHERSYINKPTSFSKSDVNTSVYDAYNRGRFKDKNAIGFNPRSGASILSGEDYGAISQFDPYTNQKTVQYHAGEVKDINRKLSIRTTSDRYSSDIPGWLSTVRDLFMSKPAEGSTLDILERSAKPRLGGGSGGGASGLSPQTEVGRGLDKQIKEQFRHAAIWSMYAPILGGAAYGVSKALLGDRYTEKGIHSLIGVGMDSPERDKSTSWAYRQARLNPFTHPDQHAKSLKETISGLGEDPTRENLYRLQKQATQTHHYSSYAMVEPALAARMLSRQSQMAKSVSEREKGKSATQLFSELANFQAALTKTSTVRGQELAHFMQVAGSSLMGKQGFNWSKEESLAFATTFLEAGLGESNLATSAKHFSAGGLSIEHMAKTKLFMNQYNANIDKVGLKRAAVPIELLTREYYNSKKHPERTHLLGSVKTDISNIMTSGNQEAVLNMLQGYSTDIAYMQHNIPKSRTFTSETDQPLIQFLAGLQEKEAARRVKETKELADKGKHELFRSKARTIYDVGKASVADTLKVGADEMLTWAGSNIPGLSHIVNVFAREAASSRASALRDEFSDAVAHGDQQGASEAAVQHMIAISRMKDVRYTGRFQRDLIGAGIKGIVEKTQEDQGGGKISFYRLPLTAQKYFTTGEMSKLDSKQKDFFANNISDMDNEVVKGLQRHRGITSDDKFSFLSTGDNGGLVTPESFAQVWKELPKNIADAIAKEMAKQNPGWTVNVNTGEEGTTVHTNKSTSSIPPEPPNAKPAGYFKWGR